MNDQRPEQLTSGMAENVYNLQTSYRFAKRYVAGKSVINVGSEGVVYGTQLLSETAKCVVGLTDSSEALRLATTVHSAPNTSYREADLPELPYPEDSFDAAIAIAVVENLERPEDFVAELKRVLRQDGILIISTPDKQAYSNDRNYRDLIHRRGMYIPMFREMLEQHFGHVSLYRQGAVAGGLIFPFTNELVAASVESMQSSSTRTTFGTKPPITHFVVAVCSDSEVPQEDGAPYLLLDLERRIFEEYEEQHEDIRLLRDEIQQMQDTEVQAFLNALQFHTDAAKRNLRKEFQNLEERLQAIENSRAWRLLSTYRSLRAKLKF